MAETPREPGNDQGLTRRRFVASGVAVGTAAAWGAAGAPGVATAGVKNEPAGDPPPAFPGAEGAGMYATGGRGGSVYEVTNLNDSGPGSFRKAVSGSDRTVVFRVSGNIELEGGLHIVGPNLTIAGQTAPGAGISVNGNQTKIAGNNIILRYLRFRGGDLGGPIDTMNGRGQRDIIVDHCSFSWGVDECLSLYGNTNMTVQWCVISEGLAMSVHPERHSMGGLWGGDHVTYHHNLLIHQAARNPRFSFTEGQESIVDHRNNLIYNYGFTSCYGGEWCNGINIVGNYYKPGPNTLAEIEPVIVAPGRLGLWHVAKNHVEGHPEVTADNELGIDYPAGGITSLEDPVQFDHEVSEQDPADAYADILREAGATRPQRDAIDARLVDDVRNGTGRIINSQAEVGGWVPMPSAPAPKDSDHDGMPDGWEKEHGLDPADPADRNGTPGGSRYTNLERYLNSIGAADTSNPKISLTRPEANATYGTKSGKQTITMTAEVAARSSKSITKVEFFNGADKIGEATKSPYQVTWKGVVDGSYFLTARATDSAGLATTSSALPVHVNRVTDLNGWREADVGEPPIPGSAALVKETMTVKGSGKIGTALGATQYTIAKSEDDRPQDCFHYVYQPVRVRKRGQVIEIITRVDHVSRPYTDVLAGLMIRDSLATDSPFMMVGLSYTNGGMRAKAVRIAGNGPEPSVGVYPYDGDDPLEVDQPHWLRLIRRIRSVDSDSEFEGFISEDSLNWTRFGYERISMPSGHFYVGLAVDGNKQRNEIDNYTTARFSRTRINT